MNNKYSYYRVNRYHEPPSKVGVPGNSEKGTLPELRSDPYTVNSLNHGPFLGTLNKRGRLLLRTPKGDHYLEKSPSLDVFLSHRKASPHPVKKCSAS